LKNIQLVENSSLPQPFVTVKPTTSSCEMVLLLDSHIWIGSCLVCIDLCGWFWSFVKPYFRLSVTRDGSQKS